MEKIAAVFHQEIPFKLGRKQSIAWTGSAEAATWRIEL